jgi:hypothetical protein
VSNWLRARRAIAGALSEDVMPVLLVVDSGPQHLHGCRSPVGFGAGHQVQIALLRASIAISRSDGDLAKDSLYNRNPLYPVALTN